MTLGRSAIRVLHPFACLGAHAIGMDYVGGFEHVAFWEINKHRRAELQHRYPNAAHIEDVRQFVGRWHPRQADIIFGGPPCQKTSVAAAIHGKRTGESLWWFMLEIGLYAGCEWFVVEQPPGNSAWEAEVTGDLSRAGFHSARVEFEARDVGAPYERRRVFILACTSLPRLEIAWRAIPQAIERVARAADARGSWDPDKLASIPVDARSAGEFKSALSNWRREEIEALGDSNPPEMAEVIGHALLEAA